MEGNASLIIVILLFTGASQICGNDSIEESVLGFRFYKEIVIN